jgi:hypothetical protein
MKISPDTLETVGVNELFVEVTVDASFTIEHTVARKMDMEMTSDSLEIS